MSQNNPFSPNSAGPNQQPMGQQPMGDQNQPYGQYAQNMPNTQGTQGQNNFQGYGQYPMEPPKGERNTLAMVSMILSLVGLVFFITAPIGAILGHVAMGQLKTAPHKESHTMALVGIILGWVITALGILSIIAAIAMFDSFINILNSSTSIEELLDNAAGTISNVL